MDEIGEQAVKIGKKNYNMVHNVIICRSPCNLSLVV